MTTPQQAIERVRCIADSPLCLVEDEDVRVRVGDLRSLLTQYEEAVEALRAIAAEALNNPPGNAMTRRDMILRARAILTNQGEKA